MNITSLHMIRYAGIGGLLLASSLFTMANAGQLVKWVDEQGNVHYGDSVPTELSGYERKVLSNQGVIMMTIERAKTSDEIKEESRIERIRKEEERKIAEQKAKDHVLLATFSNEDDMIMTRDGKIAAIDTIIRLAEDRIRRVTQQLQELAHRAANIERSGKPVSEDLHQQIASGKAEIEHHKQYIKTQRHEQESIRQQFAQDILRFRELRKKVAGAAQDSY